MADNAVGIKDILVSASVGTFGTDIFIGKLPLTPDLAVGIMQSGGKSPNPLFLVDFPSIQVMVRGKPNDYQGAIAKIQAVKDALLGLPVQTINGDKWSRINIIGDINNLGYDDLNRITFSINFSLVVEPASGTNRI